jgi:hypothetical protein
MSQTALKTVLVDTLEIAYEESGPNSGNPIICCMVFLTTRELGMRLSAIWLSTAFERLSLIFVVLDHPDSRTLIQCAQVSKRLWRKI